MLSFTMRRIVVALAVALTVSIVSFLLLHLSGDLAVAIAGPEASPDRVRAIRVEYGRIVRWPPSMASGCGTRSGWISAVRSTSARTSRSW